MEKSDGMIDAVLLLDNYREESSMLRQSFRNAGFTGPVIVIEDDGFLPEDVISVYQYFCGSFREGSRMPGKARYFNQIDVPDYWEISGTSSNGKVTDLHHVRGRIFYAEPKHKRLARVVDWMALSGLATTTINMEFSMPEPFSIKTQSASAGRILTQMAEKPF